MRLALGMSIAGSSAAATADTTAPVVTSSSYDGGTTTVSLDIVEASGTATCYWALVANPSTPTEAQVVAGTGGGILEAGSFTVTTGGDTDLIDVTDVTGNEIHIVIKDAAGNSTGTPSAGNNTIITGVSIVTTLAYISASAVSGANNSNLSLTFDNSDTNALGIVMIGSEPTAVYPTDIGIVGAVELTRNVTGGLDCCALWAVPKSAMTGASQTITPTWSGTAPSRWNIAAVTFEGADQTVASYSVNAPADVTSPVDPALTSAANGAIAVFAIHTSDAATTILIDGVDTGVLLETDGNSQRFEIHAIAMPTAGADTWSVTTSAGRLLVAAAAIEQA